MQYEGKPVLFGVSFEIPAKKLTIFKGESGRGKTTSIDMICSLIEPTEGEILVANQNLKDINTRKWREQIGYVDQFPFLFKGTIKDNILFDNSENEKDLGKCIKLCHLEDFTTNLEDGLDFQLNEGGTNISGGQRQRIAIARSVIRNPAYLILDEPTSALDEESAKIILETLKDLSKKMSVIVISHSSLADKYADKIINFDEFHK